MPPRKRKRPSDPQNAVSPSASNANHTGTEDSPSQPSTSFLSGDDAVPPFLNTSFSTHRVSPLYVGSKSLTQDRLNVLSQRLRDLLVGDVVRGVEVGLDRATDDGAMRRAGALEVVALGWVRLESLAGRYVGSEVDVEQQQDPDDSTSTLEAGAPPGRRRALQISMQYENAECAALLLPTLRVRTSTDTPGQDGSSASTSLLGFGGGRLEDDGDFLHLPLLLLRMPAPLKKVIIDFISGTFDCRISSLSLGTRSLVGALERWMGESKIPANGQFARDVMLTLGFYTPTVTQAQHKQGGATAAERAGDDEAHDTQAPATTMGIKSIDVIIPNSDLRRFVRAGKSHDPERSKDLDHGSDTHRASAAGDLFGPAKRRRLGGDKDEESWTWRSWHSPSKDSSRAVSEATRPQPFTEALAEYIRKHLALDMFHPAVRITKIACGGFVLSESRVKIFGSTPSGDHQVALSDINQRAVWVVLDGLLARADVKPVERTLSGDAVVEGM